VVIGTETGYPGLESSALVVFPFGWRQWRGILGVLGPMRMNYAQVFSLTAQSVVVLNEHLERAAHRSDSQRPV
jgi:transcriptional regulator of heat shock response